MNRHTAGLGLIAVGIAVQFLYGTANTQAATNNVPVNQVPLGSLLGPLQSFVPWPLGYTLIVAGAIVAFVPIP